MEGEETAMRRFGVLVASAALVAALAASGPALAFGGGHMGGGFSGGHMGGGFSGGHMGGGFGGRSMAMGGFNRGFAGRSVAIGGVNRGFAFNRGFDQRFTRSNHFHHFHNRFAFFPFFSGGSWDYGYPYRDDAYPDYAYDYGYPGYDYSSASPDYAAAPLVTGRSVATGQMGNYCTTPVKTCELYHASYAGNSCSCRVPGGRARGSVTP
jgi:hypothetical protein